MSGKGKIDTGSQTTITGNSGGTVSADSANNINVFGEGPIEVTGTPDKNTLTLSSKAFPLTYFTVGPLGKANFQTVQSALDAVETSGESSSAIFVYPGTYKEDLNFSSNLPENLVIIGFEKLVIFQGNHTCSGSGYFSFENIYFSSSTSAINFSNANVSAGFKFCYFNNTGDLCIDSAGGTFYFEFCEDYSNTGGFLNCPEARTVIFEQCRLEAEGTTTISNANKILLTSTHISGTTEFSSISLEANNCDFFGKISISGDAISSFDKCRFFNTDDQTLTIDSTKDTIISSCFFSTSSDPVFMQTSTGVVSLFDSTFATGSSLNDLVEPGTVYNGKIKTDLEENTVVLGGGQFGELKTTNVADGGHVLMGVLNNAPKFVGMTSLLGTIDIVTDDVSINFEVAPASEDQPGSVEMGTAAEAIAGNADGVVITPIGLSAKLGVQTENGMPYSLGSDQALQWISASSDGQIVIGYENAAPQFGDLVAGENISIDQEAGSITISGKDPITWNYVDSDTVMETQSGYIVTASSGTTVELTLPTISSVGDTIEVVLNGDGNFKIMQNDNQQQHLLTYSTTSGTGGYMENNNPYCNVVIMCLESDRVFAVQSRLGTYSMV